MHVKFDFVNCDTLRLEQDGHHFADIILKLTFMNENFSYFVWYFTEVCVWWSHRQEVNIGSGNGLVLIRQQAITWSNVDQDVWCPKVFLVDNELNVYVAFGRILLLY